MLVASITFAQSTVQIRSSPSGSGSAVSVPIELQFIDPASGISLDGSASNYWEVSSSQTFSVGFYFRSGSGTIANGCRSFALTLQGSFVSASCNGGDIGLFPPETLFELGSEYVPVPSSSTNPSSDSDDEDDDSQEGGLTATSLIVGSSSFIEGKMIVLSLLLISGIYFVANSRASKSGRRLSQ